MYLAGYRECILKSLILSVVTAAKETEFLVTFRGAKAHDYDWLSQFYRQISHADIPRYITPHFAL